MVNEPIPKRKLESNARQNKKGVFPILETANNKKKLTNQFNPTNTSTYTVTMPSSPKQVYPRRVAEFCHLSGV